MLKRAFFFSLAALVPAISIAADIMTDMDHDGRMERIAITKGAHGGASVSIYDGAKLLGKFDNLVVDESSISSTVSAVLGGGIAVLGDSDGSRNKYHIVAPITLSEGRFYIGCIYKSSYDAVDEKRSVGVVCDNIELSKFDLSGAINDKGLVPYVDDPVLAKRINDKNCRGVSSSASDGYQFARCEDDRGIPRQLVINKSGDILIDVRGYDLYHEDGDDFVLDANASENGSDQAIFFRGRLSCLKSGVGDYSGGSENNARMGDHVDVAYRLDEKNNCLSGYYKYLNRNVPISLSGVALNGVHYLVERNGNGASTGLFILDKIKPSISGFWVGAPPGKVYSIK